MRNQGGIGIKELYLVTRLSQARGSCFTWHPALHLHVHLLEVVEVHGHVYLVPLPLQELPLQPSDVKTLFVTVIVGYSHSTRR